MLRAVAIAVIVLAVVLGAAVIVPSVLMAVTGARGLQSLQEAATEAIRDKPVPDTGQRKTALQKPRRAGKRHVEFPAHPSRREFEPARIDPRAPARFERRG